MKHGVVHKPGSALLLMVLVVVVSPPTDLHELCDKEHAAHLQTGPVELHDVAVVQLGQGLHLLQEQLKLLAAGGLSLHRTTTHTTSAHCQAAVEHVKAQHKLVMVLLCAAEQGLCELSQSLLAGMCCCDCSDHKKAWHTHDRVPRPDPDPGHHHTLTSLTATSSTPFMTALYTTPKPPSPRRHLRPSAVLASRTGGTTQQLEEAKGLEHSPAWQTAQSFKTYQEQQLPACRAAGRQCIRCACDSAAML